MGITDSFFIPRLSSNTIEEKKEVQVKKSWRLPENTTIISIVLLMFLGNLLVWGPQAIAVPAFFSLFHMSAIDLGAAITCGKVGILVGLEVLRRVQISVRNMAPVLALSLALYASGFLLLGIVAPVNILWWGAVVFLINTFEACISPFLNTLISFFYPDVRKRAGMMSLVVSLGNLGEPAGSLVAGLSLFNPAVSLGLIGALGAAVSLAFAAFLFRQTRNLSKEAVS